MWAAKEEIEKTVEDKQRHVKLRYKKRTKSFDNFTQMP